MGGDGEIKSRDGKSVLEVLVYQHDISGKMMLPGETIDLSESPKITELMPITLALQIAKAVTACKACCNNSLMLARASIG